MKIYRYIKYYLIYLPSFSYLAYKYNKKQFSLQGNNYQLEISKHKKFLKQTKDKLFFFRILNWFNHDLMYKNNNQIKFSSNNEPIIIVLVHNELDKLKMFFDYHKKLGIKNFIAIANNSPIEITNWLLKQSNTKVYTVKSKYTSYYKSAWIQKALALNGYDKWYLVLDCDELIDFPKQDINDFESLIKSLEAKECIRSWGFLVDFYANNDLFETKCQWNEILNTLSYFDKDSYDMRSYTEPFTKENILSIWGGFRQRCFYIDILLSKEALFKFSENDLYENHYLFPLTKTKTRKCDYILKHYKFLRNDYQEFANRAKNKNFSLKSKKYIKYIDPNNKWNPKYEGTTKYKDKNSLSCLPFVK